MSTDRKSLIREAAERAKAQKEQEAQAPVGRWIRIENALGAPANGGGGNSPTRQRLFIRAGRTRHRRVWGAVLPMKVTRGTRIRVENGKGRWGWWYVVAVVPSTPRPDGSCVVTVSKKPVAERPDPQAPAPKATPEPMPQGRFVTTGHRNPRICEACDGPCRPGAGVCDKCRENPPVLGGDRSSAT